jgi:hypothetical protein
MSKYANVHDLKQKLIRIVNYQSKQSLSEESLRLWQLEGRFDIKGLKNFFKENRLSRSSQIYQSENPDNMEENTKVEFPGECLEYSKSIALEDLNITSRDLIVVEIST